MKRLLCLISALCLLLCLCACNSAPVPSESSTVPSSAATSEATTEATTEPTYASTTEAPTTTAPQSLYELGACSVRTYRDENGTIWAMGIAEIVNTGDKPLYLDYGSFELRNSADEVVMTADAIAAYPQILLPGESGYYFEVVEPDLPDTEALTLYVTPDVCEAEVECVRYTVTDTRLKNSPYGGLELWGKVENATDSDGELVCIAAVLLDAEDKPLGLLTTILTDQLKAGTASEFTVESFMLPTELKTSEVAQTLIFAYPLQEQP